jgi:spermidine/putrescine-binding protein
VQGYSGDIFQANTDARAAGRKFRILQGMPKEGAVLGVDNMVIDKNAARPDLALKFMNYMLDGQNSAELTNLIGSGNPNAAAVKFISPEILKDPTIFPDKAVQAKLFQPLELDRRAAAAAQQAVDRDQGRSLTAGVHVSYARMIVEWRRDRDGGDPRARSVTLHRETRCRRTLQRPPIGNPRQWSNHLN